MSHFRPWRQPSGIPITAKRLGRFTSTPILSLHNPFCTTWGWSYPIKKSKPSPNWYPFQAKPADALVKKRGLHKVTFAAVGYGLQAGFPDAANWKDQAFKIRMVANPQLVLINTGYTGPQICSFQIGAIPTNRPLGAQVNHPGFYGKLADYRPPGPARGGNVLRSGDGRTTGGLPPAGWSCIGGSRWRTGFRQESFTNDPRVNGYAYGFSIATLNGQRLVWHGGDLTSYHSALFMRPTQNTGFFVAFNGADSTIPVRQQTARWNMLSSIITPQPPISERPMMPVSRST